MSSFKKRGRSLIVIICVCMSILVGAGLAYADGTNWLSVGRYVYSRYHSWSQLGRTIAYTSYNDMNMNSTRSVVTLYTTRYVGSSATSVDIGYGVCEVFNEQNYAWSAITNFNFHPVRSSDYSYSTYRYMSGFSNPDNNYLVYKQRFLLDDAPFSSNLHIFITEGTP